jgi:hypothetical protein
VPSGYVAGWNGETNGPPASNLLFCPVADQVSIRDPTATVYRMKETGRFW